MAPVERKYELVLFGATGYTGVLTAEYIARHLPTDLKWAVAGRSEAKLSNLVENIKKLNPDRVQPGVEISGLEKDELHVLARKTKLLITTVGPFALYGTPVLEACANNGTHYIDTTGEYFWTLEMIQRYHETAKANGAIMIPQCGLESAPHDLLSWALVSAIREKFSVGTKEVLLSLDSMSLNPSGGSLATIFAMFETVSMRDLLKAEKTWAHSPVSGTERAKPASLIGLRQDPTLGTLSVAALTESANRSIVHRSWGLMGNGSVYGQNFHYVEYSKTSGVLAATFLRVLMVVMMAALALPPVRWLIKKFVYAPGSGPDPDVEAKATTAFTAIGTADQDTKSPARVLAKLDFSGGPYHLTGLYVAEAAITILRDKTVASKLGGGLLTPAMLGQPLLDRLSKTGAAIKTQVL